MRIRKNVTLNHLFVKLKSMAVQCMTMSVAADGTVSLAWADKNDVETMDSTVRRHIGMVYSAALRRVGCREMAEDVTQAVFIVLARRRGRWPSEEPLGPWLLKTVKYAAANAIKIEARRRRHELAAARAFGGACSHDPTEVLVWQEISGRVDDAVLRLPEADRRVVMMRYFQGRSNQEIAAELYVSETAVKLRLHRAIEKIAPTAGAI